MGRPLVLASVLMADFDLEACSALVGIWSLTKVTGGRSVDSFCHDGAPLLCRETQAAVGWYQAPWVSCCCDFIPPQNWETRQGFTRPRRSLTCTFLRPYPQNRREHGRGFTTPSRSLASWVILLAVPESCCADSVGCYQASPGSLTRHILRSADSDRDEREPAVGMVSGPHHTT